VGAKQLLNTEALDTREPRFAIEELYTSPMNLTRLAGILLLVITIVPPIVPRGSGG